MSELSQKEKIQQHFRESVDRWASVYEADDFIAYDIIERQRLVLKIFQRVVKPHLPPDALVVDAGCGAGKTAALLRSSGFRVIGLDSVPGMLSNAQEALSQSVGPPCILVQADVENMSLAERSVDCLILMGVLEYLEGPDECMKEVLRVLKPDGFVIITAPNPDRLMAAVHRFAKRLLPGGLVERLRSPRSRASGLSFTHIPYAPASLHRLGESHRLSPVGGVGHGFGPLTWRDSPVLSLSSSIKLSRLLFKLSGKGPLRWLQAYGNAYILCAKKASGRERSGAKPFAFEALHAPRGGPRRRMKRTAKRAFLASGLAGCLDLLPSNNRGKAPCWILAYHSMAGTNYYEDGDYSIPEAQERFARQILLIMKNFVLSPFREVLETWRSGSSLEAPTVVLTFDDGLMDQYTVAWPVLRQLGVPATFFICPDYVDSPESIYVEQIASYIHNSPCKELSIESPLPGSWSLRTNRERRKAVWDLIGMVKPLSKEDRDRVLNGWASKLLVDTGGWSRGCLTMSWPQIRELAEGGMDIGSHSLSHPSMAHLDSEALKHELEWSRKVIGERVGQRPDTFCYPYGGIEDFNKEVISEAEKAGYQGAVTVLPGWADESNDPFALPRVCVQLSWEREDLRCAMIRGVHRAVEIVPRLRGFVFG